MKKSSGVAAQTPVPESPVLVIGHCNPDTDSICSAIAYARFKSLMTDKEYYPRRVGQINQETRFVLDRFKVPQPLYVDDVRRQVMDMEMTRFDSILSSISLKSAWELMAELDVVTLPIVSEENVLIGIITEGDIAESYMGMYDPAVLSHAKTPLKNLLEAIDGNLKVGDKEKILDQGKVLVAAANPDAMEEFIEPGDIVITGNRYESQLCAIEMKAGCVIVTGGAPVSKTIAMLAETNHCIMIETPYDTFTVSRLINQSIPIDFFMKKEHLVTFDVNDYIDDVKVMMTRYRHRDFPVVDKEGKLVGTISRRKLLGARKKKVILVDHNEVSQAVDGIEDAEILEIIDHHRLGSMETMNPVFFRNQPLGCTSTIIFQMYKENDLEIDAQTAGLMCSAIISDTLLFRSPTCTPFDKAAALELARISGINLEEYAKEMFAAGSDFSSKTADEIFYQDYKTFNMGEKVIGIGQITSMNEQELQEISERIKPFMEKVRNDTHLDMVLFMLTYILEERSIVLCCGEGSEEVLSAAFDCECHEGAAVLPGVVSRKKQMVPSILSTIQNENL